MGGKNHQPCSGYLEESTRWSRNLSLAQANLELANVALEDAILAELAGEDYSVEDILDYLYQTLESFSSARNSAWILLDKMKRLKFQDFTCIKDRHFDRLGINLASQGVVDEESWQEALTCIREEGFVSLVEKIEQRIEYLANATGELALCVKKLSGKNIVDVMEENREGNIRVPFAKIYSGISSFNQLFLASSLISSEAWYQSEKTGSLQEFFCTVC